MSEEKFYKNGLKFECQQSGKCCVARGEYGYVYLTALDVRRLARKLGLGLVEFMRQYVEFHEGPSAEYERLIALKHKGDCQFLDGHKCSVYEARPTQCRTWPFWPENVRDAKAWNAVSEYCPGIGQGKLHSQAEIEANLGQDCL